MWRAVVSQPLDRSSNIEPLGQIDTQAGEFWVNSPFQMPELGHNLSAFEANRLFINVSGERFFDASFASQVDIDSDSRSAISCDFDSDGDVDLLVGSVGGGPMRMFHNQISTSHHRVRIALRGTTSNALGIGSRLTVTCGSNVITRDQFPANGFMGQNPAELIIGVGEATQIDKMSIRWPSGETQTFIDLPVDRELSFVEGETGYGELSF